MMRTAPKGWLVGLGLFAAGCTSGAVGDSDPPATDEVSELETPADQSMAADEPLEAAATDEAQSEELETLSSCSSAAASFSVSPGVAVGGPLVGFGAQFNSYLYQRTGRFNQSKIDELAGALNKLHPQHVRIFFDSRAFEDASYKTSFSRTVALAQNAGATINVTYWHGPYEGAPGTDAYGKTEMTKFAAVLKSEFDAGHSAIQYVTIQNEPNRTKFNSHKKDFVQLYKTLH